MYTMNNTVSERNNNNNSRNNKNSRKNTLRSNGSNSKKRSRNNSSVANKKQPTFAAKLAAFILQGVPAKEKISWSETGGFSGKQKQVSGVLPYLHLNISEKEFRSQLKGAQSMSIEKMGKVCKSKKLEKKLSKVNFNCVKQCTNGVLSVEDGLIDSIKNRWNMRSNGKKHLSMIEKYMNLQVKMGIIPTSSVAWAK